MDSAIVGAATGSPPRRWWALYAAGELDLATGPRLTARIRRATDRYPTDGFVVDLSAVTFMDCAGMRPLLWARNQVGDRLHLRSVPPRVLDLFVLTQVAEHLEILPAGTSWPAGADPAHCTVVSPARRERVSSGHHSGPR